MTLRMRNQASTTAENLRRSVVKTGEASMKMGTRFGKSIKSMRTSTAGLMSQMISLKTLIIATFAYRILQRFGRFLSSLTELYKVQEVATRKLYQTLAAQGNYYKDTAKELTEYAGKLQYVVAIDNEVIEAQMGLLAAYGMSTKEIKEAIIPALDLSIARNIDLRAAVDLIGKAYVGYTGTLSRYGIIIDANLTKEEKYNAAMKELAKMQGVAAGVAATYAGKVDMVKSAWDDFKKGLGGVLAKGIENTTMLDGLKNSLINGYNWLIKWQPLLADIAGKGLQNLINKFVELIAVLKDDSLFVWAITFGNIIQVLVSAFRAFFRMVSTGLAEIRQFITVIGHHVAIVWIGLIKGNTEAAKAYSEWMKTEMVILDNLTVDRARKRRKAADEDWESVKKNLQDIKNAWSDAGRDDLASGIGRRMESINAALRAKADAQAAIITNQQKINDETQKTFTLTQNMAKQFGLASRMEQEQTKYLLSRLSSMRPEDIGGLSEMEKTLISRQSVLKETYGRLFGEYAQEELGIQAEFLKTVDTKIEIDLTPEAKEIIKINRVETDVKNSRVYERTAG